MIKIITIFILFNYSIAWKNNFIKKKTITKPFPNNNNLSICNRIIKKQGKNKEALACYEKSSKIQPRHIPTLGKLGIADGTVLSKPLIEFSYKNDDLGDPVISREHILEFGWVKDPITLDLIIERCLRINDFMQGMFRGVGIKLVDFKLEFGRSNIDNELMLADEISPDTCRLWDVSSEKKLDKDRFRKDLGNIVQAYQEVARRLGIIHEESNISSVKFGKPKAVNIKKK